MVLELRTDDQTLINDVNFEYFISLNEVSKAEIVLAGNNSLQSGLLTVGNYLNIYRNGNLDFRGKINLRGNQEGNSIKLVLRGEEEEYVKKNCDTSVLGTKGVWTDIVSDYIFEDLISQGVKYSVGHIDAGVEQDFKISNSTSLWTAIANLADQTTQEIYVDYDNQQISIYDYLGSENVDFLNLGADFETMVFQEEEAQAKKVIVYGKGDGDTQVIGSATASDYTEGEDNVLTLTDSTIISEDAANKIATAKLNSIKQNIKTYEIPISNSQKDYSLGDTLTINAPAFLLVDELVRIVGIRRGRKGGKEYLNIEITNAENSKIVKSSKQKISQIQRQNKESSSYMQGSGNVLTFGPTALNAKNGAPMTFFFNLAESFIKDETGKLRINSFTVDYDLDPTDSTVDYAGTLSEDLDIDGTTVDDSPPVIGETASENLWKNIDPNGSSVVANLSADSWHNNVRSSDKFDGRDYSLIIVELTLTCNTTLGFGHTLDMRLQIGGSTQVIDYFANFGFSDFENALIKNYLIRSINEDDVDIDLDFRCSADVQITAAIDVYGFSSDHTHAAGSSLDAEEHGHSAGTPSNGIYVSANDFNSIFSIGDGDGGSGSVNSSSVDIYIDWWNGSAWINKHAIFNTNKTLDYGVDVSDNNKYPDVSGFWRVRIEPNSSSYDLVIGSATIKHYMDN